MQPLLGIIADDYTGATDIASMCVRAGLETIQWFGVPEPEEVIPPCEVLVIALKSRSIPATEAINQSVSACIALKHREFQRIYFKYCSTFDSTPEGNIGPVSEALMSFLYLEQTIFCPAFPENGRIVRDGILYVHGKPLNQSGMEHHPLNPMTDANLVRVLQQQSQRTVGLIDHHLISEGHQAISDRLADLKFIGLNLVIVDALDNHQLSEIAKSVIDAKLVTGGSALAYYLCQELAGNKVQQQQPLQPAYEHHQSKTIILSGSCSQATLLQNKRFIQQFPQRGYVIDIAKLMQGDLSPHAAIHWVNEQQGSEPLLITSTCEPTELAYLQDKYGVKQTAVAVENFHSAVAQGLIELGIKRIIIAGGETSGAIVRLLGISGVRIGQEISPGVPWVHALSPQHVSLVLKSGNFGQPDFFLQAAGGLL